nr:peptidyl-prolyl cis-trans isomerase PIN4 [Colletotrichum truncatum]KAF6797254.1 peptidyl-prolyl cis-trans isomerase PIN4 [Colletotrichum truncatum]
MGKNDKKPADKKDGGKSAGGKKGGKGESEEKGGKVKGAQSINVRHILCEKHGKKEEALAKLKDGAKFDEVAREFSEDKARQGKTSAHRMTRRERKGRGSGTENHTGGSLGWKTKGSLDPKFEDVAFGLATSTTSSPVIGEAKSEFGYHIIMVEGKK